MNIHENFNKLTEHQQRIISDMIWNLQNTAKSYGIPLAGDDRAERVVEAIATWIVESKA